MRREFHQTHTVRYDECDCYGNLTPAAFLRYMQDIAALDTEDVQLEAEGYWIVKRTIISFTAPIKIHTRLDLKTFGIGFTRITAQRGYEAYIAGEAQEEPVVSANSLWVFVDKNGRPRRLPERTAEIWHLDNARPQEPLVAMPPTPESEPYTTEATVRFSDMDVAMHMNNAAYVEVLDNAAWEAYAQNGLKPEKTIPTARYYDIEYAESMRFGEKLEIQSWFEPQPTTGQEASRIQSITHNGKVAVRAHSRWHWQGEE
ncbi:acyl-[acyl-carrier-protein] thioesterase [Ktedonospora formicarum]|uniref:Acyl-ACP thioesterase n=1 Tax=Ktedonospora formicarum TaxID=2778364 RepID=A0A8J3MSZ4_9CHLR|nr:thioesterase family protein [Ktedonospora formicarum]GHO46630.1 acyl-ACP thioesterase [Ktedonospora formicarum]